jgi:amidase
MLEASLSMTVVNTDSQLPAVIFGKTTMPQTGMALETHSNLWGRTWNPRDNDFGSGGSSGGDGALVAMRGVPCAPLASDIGGSIRAPAAFNGLYGMRPSSDRVPKLGVLSTAPGQNSIKVSVGPICHGMIDMQMLLKLLLAHPTLPYEPTCIAGSWSRTMPANQKLNVGIMSSDGVVDPHPPIQRALRETAEKLTAAGHDGRRFTKTEMLLTMKVFDFEPPFDLWEAAETTVSNPWSHSCRSLSTY